MRVIGTISRGQAVADTIRPLAIAYAQQHSDKRVGMVAQHPSQHEAATLVEVAGEIATLAYVDGRTQKYPLLEILDPNIAAAYIRNLGEPGATLKLNVDADQLSLTPLHAASLLQGPPDVPEGLPGAARALLILGWAGLRRQRANWCPGYVGLLIEEEAGTRSLFAPEAFALGAVGAIVKLDPLPQPLRAGVLRLFLCSSGDVTVLDLCAGTPASGAAP